MRKIGLKDVQNIYEYEKVRDKFRRQIIELKKLRRVSVGDRITFLFENRETILFQIQEMIRTERIVDDAKVQEEIEVYNELLPDAGELAATMFIEITEQAQIKPELERLFGLTSGDKVYLEIGNRPVYAAFEAGREEDGKLSAVQYVKFPLSAEDRSAFNDPDFEVALVIDHPNYRARCKLTPEMRAELSKDFATEET